MITTAGSGGLEAAVVNTMSPGDKVLGVSIGSFGDRFAKIAGIYGADVTKLDAEWGYAAAADEVRETLRANPGVKAVLLTHNETSTGVMNPIAELAAAVRAEAPDALILVDSVQRPGRRAVRDGCLGRRPRRHGLAEGLDVGAGAGHDRGLAARVDRHGAGDDAALLPRPARPSRRGRQRPDAVHPGDRRRLPGRRGAAPDERGGQGRHLRPPRGLRRGGPGRASALGFQLFADPAVASKTVTAAWVPEDLDWKAFNGEVKRRGVVLAGGQGKLTGKIFRLGHLGSVTIEEILGAISTLEFVSLGMGRPVAPGSAVAAAQVAALEAYGVRPDAGTAREGPGRRAPCRGRHRAPPRHHEVDERIGLTRDELCAAIPEYDALVVRSQVQVDAAPLIAENLG